MTGIVVKKSTMERYDIRIDNENKWRCLWAVISISDDGFFNAQTDCGDFSYRWGAFGDCFKSFLIEINSSDYLYSKIATKDVFVDGEETVKQFKEQLLTRRREDEVDEYEARGAWEEIEELSEETYRMSPDGFHYALQAKYSLNKALPDIYADLDLVFRKDTAAQAFCEVVMPVFVEILKEEITEKKTA